jgi:DNA-binding beta-propeller fold protein YncE
LGGFSARQGRDLLTRVSAVLVALFSLSAVAAQSGQQPILQLEAKIPLGDVRGRIDHMAFDLARQRLFVAELGNDSVGVVDLKDHKTIRTIAGLAEPQGVGYVPSTDTLYAANARDGTVRLFRGPDYAPAGRIDLGSDADNIRFDEAADRVLVGYGDGGIAVIDVKQQKKFSSVPLPAHPEGFQLGPDAKQVFINVPGVHAIVVLNAASGSQTAKWLVREGGNFPMAVDHAAGRVLIVTRNPPKLTVFAGADDAIIASVDTCGDSDDVFVDPKRGRVYVSCGAGFIDIFEIRGSAYERIAHIPTATGARTSLFVPDLDVFLLAVRATGATAAAIWVFKPSP